MRPRTRTWAAHFEYQDQSMMSLRTATSTVLHYTAPTPKEAAASAIRWWRKRHGILPEHFARCCAVSVRVFDPPPVGPYGEYDGCAGSLVFEWKLETGMGPGVTVGPGLVDDPRMVI